MDIKQLRKHITQSNTFCFFPFTQISTNPAGHLKPCCNHHGTVRDSEKRIMSINNGDTFDSFWNSEGLVNIRNKLFNGIPHDNCVRCMRDGDSSMRVQSIEMYKNDIEALTSVVDSVNNNFVSSHSPSYLELKPNNLCNLKCVMCNSYDSSQIAKEFQELSKKYNGIRVEHGRFVELSNQPGITEDNNDIWNNELDHDWSNNEEIWNNFVRLAPNLRTMSFAGGEPTIMPSVLKTLKYLVDNDYAKNIKVFLSSNFTNLNKQFLNMMPKFRQFELIASIDGFGKVNDYCRFPSNWKQVSKNYIEAKNYMINDNVKILINITVHSFNVLNLTDLLWFIEEQSEQYPFYKQWPYNINLVYSPPEQQVHILPETVKQTAKNRLNEYLSKSEIVKEFPGIGMKIKLIISELERPMDLDLYEKIKRRTNFLDNYRNSPIENYIPELNFIKE